jgi:Fe-S-cluster containining protein
MSDRDVSMTAFGGCETCDGRCCRNHLVPVTGHDIAAITAKTGLPPHRFVALWRDDIFESPHYPGARLVAGGPTMTLTLDEVGSPGRRRCVFLMELPNGQARCAVYSHRPAVCAAFPFAVDDGTVYVRHSVCGPGSWRIGTDELQSRHADVARAEFGWRQHRIVVAYWNQHVDSLRPRAFSRDELFDYLLKANDRIDQLRSTHSDEEFERLIAADGGGPGASADLGFLADIANKATTARTL